MHLFIDDEGEGERPGDRQIDARQNQAEITERGQDGRHQTSQKEVEKPMSEAGERGLDGRPLSANLVKKIELQSADEWPFEKKIEDAGAWTGASIIGRTGDDVPEGTDHAENENHQSGHPDQGPKIAADQAPAATEQVDNVRGIIARRDVRFACLRGWRRFRSRV